ncbi:MAG TPA: endoglucanase [Bdellovibrionales bacterium]|nr:endoglucanase [Bdellovibrionales bacterium]
MMELLKELCQAPGVPGREQPIIDIMERELKKSCDSVQIDNLGNVIGLKKSAKKDAKTVMISGHMDEIGFVVSYIEKSGHIRFCPRGGHVPRVLLSQRVKIYGKKILTGIVEASPAFLNRDDMNKAPEFKNMHIDVGMSDKELKKIVEVGDAIVMEGAWIEQGNMIISKAFDNRIGCYLVLETMRQLQKKKLNVNVLALGSSQEEVGVRGASVAARNFSPDIGIALDVTAAFDTPGVPDAQQVTKLGEGVAIKINDQASISNHGMVNFFKALAVKNKIKFQMEILPFGGTDAHAMQVLGGGAVCTLSIPTRYVHSPSEMLHKKDIKAGVDLLVKFLEQAEKCKLEF